CRGAGHHEAASHTARETTSVHPITGPVMPETAYSRDPAPMKRREFLSAGAAALGAANLAALDSPRGRSAAKRPDRATIRIGLIGAGENVRTVMIPGFRRIADCEIVAVANSSLPSSQRVATEFAIPRAYANWRELLEDDAVDAVCIGTWPYICTGR
ncbi:MAG TPA: Gfo/Idh/MocA family oxidoreductase, partial [Longimicrobiaceae bacterium]|nr:Gfo/Idh/MocA family oxidoreductase [Longimicrobiaceae bacterium]